MDDPPSLGHLWMSRDGRRAIRRSTVGPEQSRYYQLMSGHVAIGPYLEDKIHRALWLEKLVGNVPLFVSLTQP